MNNFIDLSTSQWIILGTISFISWYFFYVKRKRSFWERQGVKGPEPPSMIPSILTASSPKPKPKPLTKVYLEGVETYGKIYGTYNGLNPALVLAEPDLLRAVCVKDFHSFPQGFNQVFVSSIERNFLTVLYGQKWKRLRSILTPTFSSAKIKKMFHLIKVCNEEAQKQLLKLASSSEPDLNPAQFWSAYNLDIIAKCCFALNLDVYNRSGNKLLELFNSTYSSNKYKHLFMAWAPKWLVRLLDMSSISVENINKIKQLTYAVIEQRKQGKNKINDFIQLMIESEADTQDGEKLRDEDKKLTPDEIVCSSVLFLSAGQETTSTLLTWACYRLATNPDIQEKLYQEVAQANIEDYEVLQSLSYLDAVIHETLRMDPPLLLFQRVCHSDTTLPGINVQIKKGTPVSIPTYAIHHDPENYPEPEVFDPNRFLQGSPKPFTFLPFGAGPRTCIGMRFALTNAKLTLARFVRSFEVFTSDKYANQIDPMPGSFMNRPVSMLLGIKTRSS
ncbi:cytochrome P450 3A41-like [Tetranychus urticae]|uniref:Cytochrome P450 n=1 Tax=Tetranychus urticae TaxID=32264 RepID=T1L5G2_TETUR|nr:cytochrome P450 3A41-like [Tetranychus urticae]